MNLPEEAASDARALWRHVWIVAGIHLVLILGLVGVARLQKKRPMPEEVLWLDAGALAGMENALLAAATPPVPESEPAPEIEMPALEEPMAEPLLPDPPPEPRPLPEPTPPDLEPPSELPKPQATPLPETPTPTPKPKATPKPTPKPTSKPTPTPPKKPSPSPTPKPKATATPKKKPSPTVSPKIAQATPKPIDKKTAGVASPKPNREAAHSSTADTASKPSTSEGGSVTERGSGVGASTAGQGSGNGGASALAAYIQVIDDSFTSVWNQPTSIVRSAQEPVATVTIAIRRDGTIARAEITRSSGNQVMDDSIREALARVPRIDPLPEAIKSDPFVISMNFVLNRE